MQAYKLLVKIFFDTFEFVFPTSVYDTECPKFVFSAKGIAECNIEV